jgi:hypothetical protein
MTWRSRTGSFGLLRITAGVGFTCLGLVSLGCAVESQTSSSADAPTEHVEPDQSAMAVTDESQPNGFDRKERSQQSLQKIAPAIDERQKRIRTELASLKKSDLPENHWAREWAGEYYVGDGLGMNVALMVAPQSGVAYTWRGCLGLYDGNHADIAEAFDLDGDGRTDGLKLKWELEPGRYQYDSERFYFVRWNGPDGKVARRFFVPEDQMLAMVNDFNEGGFSRDGMHNAPRMYDRAAGENAHARPPVVGMPQMPAEWAKLLRVKPVDAKVLQVSLAKSSKVTQGVDTTKARILLDKGSADGLYLGLKIWVKSLSGDAATLTIDRLDEHSAEGAFQAFTSTDAVATLPKVGATIRVVEGVTNPEEP